MKLSAPMQKQLSNLSMTSQICSILLRRREFESCFTVAFAVLDKHESRQVHSDEAKLRLRNKKIQADFFQIVRNSIELDMTIVPMKYVLFCYGL